MKKVIINGTLVLKDELKKTNLLIDGEIIEGFSDSIEDGYEVIDANGLYVAPGFVDVHTHGRNACDTMNGTYEAINTMSVECLKTGVTSFLPTTMTQSIEETRKAIEAVANYMGKEQGAKVLGVHMEGPFINVSKKGAQPGEFVLAPSIEAFNEMVTGYKDAVKLITVAPEIEGMDDFISYLTSQNITVSMGHTNASYDQAKHGFEAGINHATHTFNAMNGFNHREPGGVGAIMEDDRVYAELILDGIHVHFASAKILLSQKGDDKLCLITDSMEASGLPDGKYQLGGQDVFVNNGEARLADGTLAGSVLKLNQAVRNAYQKLKLPLYTAVKLASLNPAMSIKQNDIGEIAIGKKADLIFINDNIDVLKTMINGKEQ